MLNCTGTPNNENKTAIIENITQKFRETYPEVDGEAYIGYPIYMDEYANTEVCVDLALVTRIGVFIINILLKSVTDYGEIQDNILIKVENKFKKQPFLIRKRKLIFDFYGITYAVEKMDKIEDNLIAFSDDEFFQIIDKYKEKQLFDETKYNAILSGIQEAYGLNNRVERVGVKEGTKAYLINQMNGLVEKYDAAQMDAILADTKGIQRIRGMAGSGKTIVLARKAVELHMKHRDWTIVVTYSTRSLRNQLVNLIGKFYASKNDGAKYDPKKIRIMQAWGSASSIGVYYDICLKHGISPMNFNTAKQKYGANKAFSKICENVLNDIKDFNKMYDCILIDEAQDFDKNFMRLCLNVLGTDQRLVYAYDELQKLNEETMPMPQEIFGQGIEVDTPLTVCYRNQGRAIVTAHAIGMGLYREEDKGLIQIPNSEDVWEAIGYSTDKPIRAGEPATLYRTIKTSPELLKVDPNEIIDFLSYDSFQDLRKALIEMLKKDIREEQLLPSDIMIIDMDAIESADNRQKLMNLLYEDEDYDVNEEGALNIHSAGSTSPEDFFRKNSIVYSSIYRAKGNEAFMIYIVNAQKCINSLTPRSDRNALFTAITRSKGWVRVMGFGDEMKQLCQEFEAIKQHDYKLYFKRYPTDEEKKQLILNNKDVDASIMKSIGTTRALFNKVKEESNVSNLQLMMEVLGVSTKEELLKMLMNEGEE